MKGLYVISQKDILEEPEKDDPIAISSFPIDSHDCQRIALKGGGVINEGTIFPVRRIPGQGYAYHVPYRSILPKPEQCDNLLVPVALSCTHVGISSLRIEGAWMVIGQGAGVAAALAAKDDVAVQELEYAKLRERLLAQKQVLDLPDGSDLPHGGRFHRREVAAGHRARRHASETDRQLVPINEFQALHRKRIRLQRRKRFNNKGRRQIDRDLSIQGTKVRSIPIAHGLFGS